MHNRLLLPFYYRVFGHPFVNTSREQNREMQYMIYLAKTDGVAWGDVPFIYTQNSGIISPSFASGIVYSYPAEDVDIKLSEHAANCMNRIRRIIELKRNSDYELADWMSCVCAVIHIKLYILKSSDYTFENVNRIIIEHQPELSNEKSNRAAFNIVNELQYS